ncbi:hypothetical protein, partial [Chimaeribacter arupi]|uniref:hypothetical protein n=1 Tax=Chimaeribacter arupi TaxID=2060066 RepID=UPI0019D49D0E
VAATLADVLSARPALRLHSAMIFTPSPFLQIIGYVRKELAGILGVLSARPALRLHSAMIFTPPPDCLSFGM